MTAAGEFADLLETPLADLMAEAARLRDLGHGTRMTFSPKVFIPLTHLCRDNCGYCTFVHPPKKGEAAYLTPEQVLEIARAGRKAGCAEALFTLGDKPELRYRVAAEELAALGPSPYGMFTTWPARSEVGSLIFGFAARSAL